KVQGFAFILDRKTDRMSIFRRSKEQFGSDGAEDRPFDENEVPPGGPCIVGERRLGVGRIPLIRQRTPEPLLDRAGMPGRSTLFGDSDALTATEAAVSRGGQVGSQVRAAGELLRRSNHRANFDTAQIRIASMLGVTRADVRNCVDPIVLAQEISR